MKTYLSRFILLVSLACIIPPGWAGERVNHPKHFNHASGFVDLGLTGEKFGDTKNVYKIPVVLDKVPANAFINMKFVVISTGVCHVSYEPTEVFLNGESIQEIDFRELDEGSKQNIRVLLPEEYLKIGHNTIKIISGQCNEGLDSMQFNGVSMSIDKSSS